MVDHTRPFRAERRREAAAQDPRAQCLGQGLRGTRLARRKPRGRLCHSLQTFSAAETEPFLRRCRIMLPDPFTRSRITRWCIVALLSMASFQAGELEAQGLRVSGGLGYAAPIGTFSDFQSQGYTLRGQVGLNLLVASVHAQAGWTHLSGRGGNDPVNVQHLVAGGRFGLGLLWTGLSAGWFRDPDDTGNAFGYLPEIGAGLGPLEVVLDVRPSGSNRWWSLRGGFRF